MLDGFWYNDKTRGCNMTHNKTHWKKDILLFLTSQTISLFGSSLVQYAIM